MLRGGYIFYILVSKYEEKRLAWITANNLGVKVKKYSKITILKIIIIFIIIRK